MTIFLRSLGEHLDHAGRRGRAQRTKLFAPLHRLRDLLAIDYLIALMLKQSAEAVQIRRVVVDHEDPSRCPHGCAAMQARYRWAWVRLYWGKYRWICRLDGHSKRRSMPGAARDLQS